MLQYLQEEENRTETDIFLNHFDDFNTDEDDDFVVPLPSPTPGHSPGTPFHNHHHDNHKVYRKYVPPKRIIPTNVNINSPNNIYSFKSFEKLRNLNNVLKRLNDETQEKVKNLEKEKLFLENKLNEFEGRLKVANDLFIKKCKKIAKRRKKKKKIRCKKNKKKKRKLRSIITGPGIKQITF